MGKAWDSISKLANKKKVVIEVGGDSLPNWAWVLVGLLIVSLYVAYRFPMGYKQGLRG